jgi:hypothetical protein
VHLYLRGLIRRAVLKDRECKYRGAMPPVRCIATAVECIVRAWVGLVECLEVSGHATVIAPTIPNLIRAVNFWRDVAERRPLGRLSMSG